MVLNTLTVAAAVTPGIVGTTISHYLDRQTRKQKPTAHFSYDQGLHLVRNFLNHASHHTVDELQAFTAQKVPHPYWVKVDIVPVPDVHIDKAADLLEAQLGPQGIDLVGGKLWWQWRPANHPLRAEWIEMSKDYNQRKAAARDAQRIMLYVHGGAYFFGAVDEHRYQIQRHARKLRARAFAIDYRLAPQFPFPCGLQDAIAAYLFLLETYDPKTILLAGDSAGAGMIVSLLVTLRDQAFPLPAGAILISPWVDLTHSFPSLSGDGAFDFIPNQGFHHRPSMAWPPPSAKDLQQVNIDPSKDTRRNSVINQNLSVEIDGVTVDLYDQIQMYTTNQLLSHPLVSPVFQPTLGGLPPLLVQSGGGELLRDEQIYLAHKAAHPAAYPPGSAVMADYDPKETLLNRYPPTNVQLQVWDDLCHVAHTLSFTRPAKYMYRAVAQFGSWAYANAQTAKVNGGTPASAVVDHDDGDDGRLSIISSDNSDTETMASAREDGTFTRRHKIKIVSRVGTAGDPIPDFVDHMIRQGVTRHGDIYTLPHRSSYEALCLDPNTVGVIKPGPVRKWLDRQKEWDQRFAKKKQSVQKERARQIAEGYHTYGANDKLETPPPTALAGRRHKDALQSLPKKRAGHSWGLALWSCWGSKHDETTIERQADNMDVTRSPTVVGPNASLTRNDTSSAVRDDALVSNSADDPVKSSEAPSMTDDVVAPIFLRVNPAAGRNVSDNASVVTLRSLPIPTPTPTTPAPAVDAEIGASHGAALGN